MYEELIDYSKNQKNILKERLNFFIINLKCFKKLHNYDKKYIEKIRIINLFGIEDYVRLKYLLCEPL